VSKNLNEAFNAAKKTRNILSKTLIWESGVSKSQFYRIIQGKETPSPETKKRIADSFGIDVKEFDLLHSQSRTGKDKIQPTKNGHILRMMLALISVLLIAIIMFFITAARKNAPLPPKQTIEKPNDTTKFIMDVTIPDGTAIPVNTEFVKTWRVQNTGSVIWKDRYLMRITPSSKLLCSSPSMVPIPETAPGEIVDISVKFITPHLPGSCRTDWKAADKHGNFYHPDKHGLFSIVTVTE
jgi:transcriptional regulator with XRE-family HTH domain